VGAGTNGEVQVRRLSRGRAARVHDDDARAFATGALFDSLPQHWMALGHVRAENKKTFRGLNVVVASWRPVRAESHFVGAGGAGHAEAGIGVDVVRADGALRQFV